MLCPHVNLLANYMLVQRVPNLFLPLYILGKSCGCQNSGSWITCYTHSFKRTLVVSLAFLEAEHPSNDSAFPFPVFTVFCWLAGLFWAGSRELMSTREIPADVPASRLVRVAAGGWRSRTVATFCVRFLRTPSDADFWEAGEHRLNLQSLGLWSGPLSWVVHMTWHLHVDTWTVCLCLRALSNTLWSWLKTFFFPPKLGPEHLS